MLIRCVWFPPNVALCIMTKHLYPNYIDPEVM